MRVALWVDMEGVSQIVDHRECWPVFPHYWATGRPRLMRDVVAAARGLLDGGASDVIVVDGHGLGWPNLTVEELPDGARTPDERVWSEGFDATFHVGFHARAGTLDGFVSHTMVPRLELTVDGRPVTESHIWSWLVAAPLLGVVGDDALETQLDGALAGTRFLAVKRSSSRARTAPVHGTTETSAEAIRAFAAECVAAPSPGPPPLPARFTVAMTLPAELAEHAVGRHELVSAGAGIVEREGSNWARDVQPALRAAMGAALRPLVEAMGDVELSDAGSVEREDARLAPARRYLVDWVEGSG
jgi:D-amino peptidase